MGLLAGLLVGAWLVVIFGRALAEADSLSRRQAQEQATNDQLRARVEAGRREILMIQTVPFLNFESRVYGMAERGERAFALEPGAPPPAGITPLGNEPDVVVASNPLDDWLALLFGA